MTRTLVTLLYLLVFGISTADASRGQKRGRDCPALHHNLQDGLRQAGAFGRVAITSVCTGRHARGSWHYRTGGGVSRAVDFRVRGNWRAAVRHLRGWPGGFAHYGGGLFHIDVGPHRRWR